jgi:glucokinase
MGKLLAGVDLGASNLRVALSDGERLLVERKERTLLTDPLAPSRQILSLLRSAVRERGDRLLGVGLASVGPLDLRRGEVRDSPNLPFRRVPLVKPLEEELGVPVVLVNDCSAAAVGEKEFGAGRGVEDLVYVGMGTGIGGGAYVDGCLLWGKDGNAVEIGHLTVDPDGRLECGCGRRGHWEAYCSGTGLPRLVGWRLKRGEGKDSSLRRRWEEDRQGLRAEHLFEAAGRGDAFALRVLEEVGRLNGIGFTDLVEAYDPSLITVGGSVALRNGRWILPPVRRWVRERSYNRPPLLRLTPLGERAGLYGAVGLIRREVRR